MPSALTDQAPTFSSYYETRERSTRNALVERHLQLAEFHSRRLSRGPVPLEDLRQVAHLAIVSAVERFDPHRGVEFTTFASRTVEGECRRYLRDRTWNVRPPRRLQETFLNVRAAQEELTNELGRVPTVEEIAARVDGSPEQVVEAIEAGNARFADEVGPGDGPDGGSPFEAVELRLTLQSVVDGLDDEEREILRLRFQEGRTERQIAAELGVSHSRLSRRLRSILRDLRRILDADR